MVSFFFFQAEDGIRDLVRSRGLGDVYKRQACAQSLINAANAAGGPDNITVILVEVDAAGDVA